MKSSFPQAILRRVTIGMIVGEMAAGRTTDQLLAGFRYLEEADIREALAYAGLSGAGCPS